MNRLFATCPKGLETLLFEELNRLGAGETKETVAGVHFSASTEVAYEVLLHTRLASRILFPLAEAEISDDEDLYGMVREIDWTEHMDLTTCFAVDANLSRSPIKHSRFAALRVKDGVVDSFREVTGARPNVDTELPDLRLDLHVAGKKAILSLDLSGAPSSQRGYRRKAGEAPLKENLAAAILLRAGWPEIAANGGALIDPMCGSGTLLIEGLMMAAGIAPGLSRKRFGLFGWKRFDTGLWSRIKSEAVARRDEGLARILERGLVFHGFDHDQEVLDRAGRAVARAGFTEHIHLGKRALAQWQPANARGWHPGLVITNPPYGKRLGEAAELAPLYASLGDVLRRCFQGWQAAVFTGNPTSGKRMGLRAHKRYKLFNGAIPCELLCFDVSPERFVQQREPGTLSEGATMFANRLRKNLKGLRKWLRREQIEAYRLYDRDMPEYNLAVDRYGPLVVVSEYAPPATIEPDKAERRLMEALESVALVCEVQPSEIVVKLRRKGKGGARYGRMDRQGTKIEVGEYDARFLINPHDYLDVGLFNDHRPIRRRIHAEAKGKRFLNLFAYTGTATVAAALGGAVHSRSVDLSNTYLTWAAENLRLNGIEIGFDHRLERADCLDWLKRAEERYDLIFLDPPTFSSSKRVRGSFDVQRDHVFLVTMAAELLRPDGIVLFSTNSRRFSLDETALRDAGLAIRDISADTIPPDYARNQQIHHCFEVRAQR